MMAEIHIQLMEANIRSKREDTMSTMQELEAVLDKLDNLDDETKVRTIVHCDFFGHFTMPAHGSFTLKDFRILCRL